MARRKPARGLAQQRRFLALRTGVAAAAASVGPSFARGLLPRSATDQAIVTGAVAAYWLGSASLGLAMVEAVAEVFVDARGKGRPENAMLLGSAVVAVCGGAVVAAVPDTHDVPMHLALGRSAAWILGGGAIASGLVIGSEKALEHTVGRRGLPTNLAVAAGLGAGTSALMVSRRRLRARAHRPDPLPAEAQPAAIRKRAKLSPAKLARSVGVGAAVGGGLVALAATQFAIAEGTPWVVSRVLGRQDEPIPSLVGHAASAAILTVAGGVALNRVRRHVMHADDVVEPAYPDPPTSPHVTAGPNSIVAFDAIGKEGRRFVTMTLTPEEITGVMGEPASQPVRAVAGFGSAKRAEDRAAIALEELERLGAFERSMIVIAAPTGVGYVNYSFAEAVEYLTRGDCAIIVPQYALVPSALALNLTRHGEQQQRLILAGIRDRIALLPPGRRPRLVQFGESLGAEVALDVAEEGTSEFAALGLERGLYLGTPFRTTLWARWFADPASVDPQGVLGQVSQAGEIASLPARVRHVMVIHHDDPINKFGFSMAVRAPWWMGPPETRPPGVPRETTFRPVVTCIIGMVDVKNGMNSKPGEFVRQGHDYRIELREAVQATFGLRATAGQAERIEQALRDRESQWAARRMVASRFAKARESVIDQLGRWGVSADSGLLDQQSAAALARGEMAPREVADSV